MPIVVQPIPQKTIVVKPQPVQKTQTPSGPVVTKPYVPNPLDGGSF